MWRSIWQDRRNITNRGPRIEQLSTILKPHARAFGSFNLVNWKTASEAFDEFDGHYRTIPTFFLLRWRHWWWHNRPLCHVCKFVETFTLISSKGQQTWGKLEYITKVWLRSLPTTHIRQGIIHNNPLANHVNYISDPMDTTGVSNLINLPCIAPG